MNRRRLRKIWICGDVWLNILPFFDRPQLGLKIALLSYRYDALVDKHFDGQKELTIWREIRIQRGKGPKSKLFVRIDDQFVRFPWPDRPLPNKIRFNDLQIFYIDRTVSAFLRLNKQIWDRMGTKLKSVVSWKTDDNHPLWKVFTRQIWPIFAPNIRHLSINNAIDFDNLRRHISSTILTDLDQMISIDSRGLFPEAISDDDEPNAATCSAGQALSKWLHTPSKSGQPKRLCFYYLLWLNLEWVKDFKKTFLSATASSVSYKISVKMPILSIKRFDEWVNERTQEKLTIDIAGNWLRFKRCPISEKAATDQWENDENWENNLNNVKFHLRGCERSTEPFCHPKRKNKKNKRKMKRAKALKRRRTARK